MSCGGVGGPERGQQHAADDTVRVPHRDDLQPSGLRQQLDDRARGRDPPTRRQRGIYGVVDKPHYALVIARADDVPGGRYAMVEQFRYPLGLRRWEFPRAPSG